MKKVPLKTPKKTAKKKTTAKKKSTAKKSPHAEFVKAMSGKNTVMDVHHLDSDELWSAVSGYVSTRCLALNKGIGAPGFPRGRIVEISGDEHTGKSTILDHVFAETQAQGGIAVLLDPEAGRDAKYTRSLGVDPEKLICPQPKKGAFYTLQSSFEFIGKTCDWWYENYPNEMVTIGVDSLSILPTEEDIKRDADSAKPGDAAKTIRHALRTLTQRVARSNILMVFITQLYSIIGPFGGQREGGGKGLAFAGSVRIRLKRGRTDGKNPILKTSDGRVYGGCTIAEIKKSKLSTTTGSKVDIPIIHGHGVDNVQTLFEAFKQHGFIGSGGGWYNMILPGDSQESVKWHGGATGLANLLRERPELYQQLIDIYMTLP